MRLVKRGCRLVLAVDATSDPAWRFDDLENMPAVRDLTVARLVSCGLRPQDPGGTPKQRIPAAPVALLRYGQGGRDVVVRYAKAALTPALFADGPLALTAEERSYVESRKRFPQQATADQFFSDAQQSAYVKVGRALAAEAVRLLANDSTLGEMRELFAPGHCLAIGCSGRAR
jgi:hypothetical protein